MLETLHLHQKDLHQAPISANSIHFSIHWIAYKCNCREHQVPFLCRRAPRRLQGEHVFKHLKWRLL